MSGRRQESGSFWRIIGRSKAGDFFFRQRPCLAGKKAGIERKTSHGEAFQEKDFLAQREKHALDLVKTSLLNGQTDFGHLSGGKDFQSGRKSLLLVSDVKTGEHGFGIFLCYFTSYLDEVGFIYMAAGREQTVSKGSVVGDQEKSFGVFVQASHRKQIFCRNSLIF